MPSKPRTRLQITLGVALAILAAVLMIIIGFRLGPDRQAQYARAITEMRAAETALQNAMNDANAQTLAQLFTDPQALYKPGAAETVQHHTDLLYRLLQNGRHAQIGLRPEARNALAATYLDLGTDPWGNRYRFYIGPWQNDRHHDATQNPFRAWPATPQDASPAIPNDGRAVFIYSHGPNSQSDQAFTQPQPATPGDDPAPWLPQ